MIVLVGANGFLGRLVCELVEENHTPAVAVSKNSDYAFFERFAPSLRVMDASDFAREVDDRACFGNRPAPAILTFEQEPWREVPENVQPAGRCEFPSLTSI